MRIDVYEAFPGEAREPGFVRSIPSEFFVRLPHLGEALTLDGKLYHAWNVVHVLDEPRIVRLFIAAAKTITRPPTDLETA